jgi:hypothetical protein
LRERINTQSFAFPSEGFFVGVAAFPPLK